MAKVQYNPRTGKVNYNPNTGKVMMARVALCSCEYADDFIKCPAWWAVGKTPKYISMVFADILNCSDDGPYSGNGEYCIEQQHANWWEVRVGNFTASFTYVAWPERFEILLKNEITGDNGFYYSEEPPDCNDTLPRLHNNDWSIKGSCDSPVVEGYSGTVTMTDPCV